MGFSPTPPVLLRTSVSIPSGQSSATFWYGDTSAGTPTITGAVTRPDLGHIPGDDLARRDDRIHSHPTSTRTPTAGSSLDHHRSLRSTNSAIPRPRSPAPGPDLLGTEQFTGPANAAPSYPASVTFVNGVASGSNAASITLYDAQATTTLTATFGERLEHLHRFDHSSLTVSPASTSGYVVVPTTPSPQTAGIAFNVSITAVDQYDNTATRERHNLSGT